MRWPWQRPPADTGAGEALNRAEKAVEEAAHHLEEVRAQWPEVHAVSRSLRRHRDRNHFADMVASSFRRRHREAS
jgi:hypothetical protein